jgi:hypothetical protein
MAAKQTTRDEHSDRIDLRAHEAREAILMAEAEAAVDESQLADIKSQLDKVRLSIRVRRNALAARDRESVAAAAEQARATKQQQLAATQALIKTAHRLAEKADADAREFVGSLGALGDAYHAIGTGITNTTDKAAEGDLSGFAVRSAVSGLLTYHGLGRVWPSGPSPTSPPQPRTLCQISLANCAASRGQTASAFLTWTEADGLGRAQSGHACNGPPVGR